MAASTNILISINVETIPSIFLENSPCKDLNAERAACSELLLIKSDIASA